MAAAADDVEEEEEATATAGVGGPVNEKYFIQPTYFGRSLSTDY